MRFAATIAGSTGRLSSLLALAVIFAGASLEAGAQTTGNRAAGKSFALQTCTPCHIVADNQRSLPRFATAPAFRAIANAPGKTETSLHVFLSSPHPTMPNLILSREEQDNVIAYILSMRRRP
jgi:mono/diheme cytochrome c family protein